MIIYKLIEALIHLCIFEVPVGTSIAITKGTLINERVGFKRDYSNTELFWHYSLAFSPKY